MHPLITQTDIDTFQKDGFVLVKGLFKPHVETLRAGIERNMAEPGPYASESVKEGEAGGFSMTIVTGPAYQNLKR